MEIERLLRKDNYSKEDIISLLSVKEKDELEILFNRADEIRKENCGDEISLFGVIEISNYCDNDCDFCYLNNRNEALKRYRLSAEEVIETTRQIASQGIGTIIFRAGNDQFFIKDILSYIIYNIKQSADVNLILSLGTRNISEYHSWKISGADGYFFRYERGVKTFFSPIYSDARPGGIAEYLCEVKNAGYQISFGDIITSSDMDINYLADAILLMKEFNQEKYFFEPFIITPGMEDLLQIPEIEETFLKVISVLRLVYKNSYIASNTGKGSNIIGEKGLKCGANILVPDFTPQTYKKLNFYGCRENERDIFTGNFLTIKEKLENSGRKISFRNGII